MYQGKQNGDFEWRFFFFEKNKHNERVFYFFI
jgi:hypothetical protein